MMPITNRETMRAARRGGMTAGRGASETGGAGAHRHKESQRAGPVSASSWLDWAQSFPARLGKGLKSAGEMWVRYNAAFYVPEATNYARSALHSDPHLRNASYPCAIGAASAPWAASPTGAQPAQKGPLLLSPSGAPSSAWVGRRGLPADAASLPRARWVRGRPHSTTDSKRTGEGEEPCKAPAHRYFTNPVIAHDCPDPGVMAVTERGRGEFYQVCTGGRFPIRVSLDMIAWNPTGRNLLERGVAPWAADGRRNWAPELHQLRDGSFVAYYTASSRSGRLAIGAARARSPTGPWIHRGGPIIANSVHGLIDPHFFLDDDGRQYLYWKVDGNAVGKPTPIYGRELTRGGQNFAPGSTPVQVLTNDPKSWEGGVVEAPWISKHEGQYYLFYSGNVYDSRYQTGVARSSRPLSAFAKLGSPILSNNDRWVGPGHGSVIDYDRRTFYFHHAWPARRGQAQTEQGRYNLLDTIQWGSDGWPVIESGTSAVGPQRVP